MDIVLIASLIVLLSLSSLACNLYILYLQKKLEKLNIIREQSLIAKKTISG